MGEMTLEQRTLVRWALPLAAAGCVAACNDTGAYVGGVNGALAVGAYHTLRFGDACSGGGKISFCSTQSVTEVLELRSEDPGIVEIVPLANHPRPDVAKSPYYVLGKATGQASLVFKARFDDGTVRADSAVVEVKTPDSARVAFSGCSGETSTNVLAALGEWQPFQLELLAKGEKLAGWLPGAVSGEGVTDMSGDGDRTYYHWQAPATPVVRQLVPGVIRKVTGSLTSFGPGQVTSIDLAALNDYTSASFYAPEALFPVETRVRVNGQLPCQGLPVELHSSTPSICSGPAGEVIWMGDKYGGTATVHSEGACVLGVSMPGSAVLTTKTFPVFLVTRPPTGLKLPGFGEPCPVEGGSACAGYTLALCKAGRWQENGQCSSDQTCDYLPDSAPGCVPGGSCARCRGLK